MSEAFNHTPCTAIVVSPSTTYDSTSPLNYSYWFLHHIHFHILSTVATWGVVKMLVVGLNEQVKLHYENLHKGD